MVIIHIWPENRTGRAAKEFPNFTGTSGDSYFVLGTGLLRKQFLGREFAHAASECRSWRRIISRNSWKCVSIPPSQALRSDPGQEILAPAGHRYDHSCGHIVGMQTLYRLENCRPAPPCGLDDHHHLVVLLGLPFPDIDRGHLREDVDASRQPLRHEIASGAFRIAQGGKSSVNQNDRIIMRRLKVVFPVLPDMRQLSCAMFGFIHFGHSMTFEYRKSRVGSDGVNHH